MAASSKGERTRQALLQAATARFGRDGYRGTSVAKVARDVHMSDTAAYAYFPNKEALFIAAVDEDAAAVIDEGLSSLADELDIEQWRETFMFTLLNAVQRHPLARRVLAGLEPEFTARLVDIPALEQLRKAVTERIRSEQVEGRIRRDIDAQQITNGLVSIMLALLMSLLQTGEDTGRMLGRDVAAVVEASLTPPK